MDSEVEEAKQHTCAHFLWSEGLCLVLEVSIHSHGALTIVHVE